MTHARTFAALVVLALVASACGSRISEEQRQFVLAGGGGGGGAEVGELAGGGEVATEFDVAGGGATAGDGSGGDAAGATATGGGGGQATGGGGGSGGSGGETATTGGGGGSGGGGGGGGAGGGGGRTDTRAAPPGGNGGSTDTGVTKDKIVVFNGSDISGAVPGLFEDAQLAAKAYFAMFAASEGTVYGRKFEYQPRDTKLNTGGNRNVYIEACEKGFAAVGSMSAFEQGAKDPIQQCGIPDIRTASVNQNVMGLRTVYPADASTPGIQPLAEYQYWKRVTPQGVKKSAYLWITSDTTRFQTRQVIAATEKIGYTWVYDKAIDISETNYAPFVLEMKRKKVRYVTFQGAYQQAARLAKAMQSQGFKPDVFALQSNAYTPNYPAEGGRAVEGTHIAVPSVILEEINQHREMQLYATWLNQVKPGERPTGLGIYAWASARLFVDAVKKAGPKLTRKGVIEALRGVHAFTGNGLLPKQDIGRKYPADCVVIVEVKGGKFVRREPRGGGFSCAKPVRV